MSIIDNDTQPQQSKHEPELTNNLPFNSYSNISHKETIVEIIETDINDTNRAIINPNESELIESSRVENKDQTLNNFSPSTTNKHPNKIIYISHINMDVVNNQRQHLESQVDVNTTVTTTKSEMKNENPKPKKKKRNNFYNPQPYQRKSSYSAQIIKYILLYVIILAFIVAIILIIIKFG